jgi:hypothetical protein
LLISVELDMSEIYFINISASFFVSVEIFVYPTILSISVRCLFSDSYWSFVLIISESNFRDTHGNNPREYPCKHLGPGRYVSVINDNH